MFPFLRSTGETSLPVSWRGLGPRSAPRVIKFKPHRKKSFDVCYPLKGDPKILISVKSMQNAYRNLTNRVEEALGDSAVLRVYSSKAVFGFFFFILDGSVARGSAEQGNKLVENGKKKGLSPFLTLVEDGGDFFDLGDVAKFRRAAGVKPSKPSERQDTIENAALSLLDLVASDHKADPSIHYDAMGFAPMVMNRVAGKDLKSADGWKPSLSPVAPLLDPNTMIARLVAAAKTRRLIV